MTAKLNDNLPEALASVRTRPLFVMRLEVAPPAVVGAIPGGVRRMLAVPGGIFEGERLSGKVLAGGSDWQMVRPDGAITLDVRMILETSDGALISIAYRGLRSGPTDVLARLDGGEAVDPGSYYFRITPVFETASPKYDWLNRVLAIGIGDRRKDGPVYSLFELL